MKIIDHHYSIEEIKLCLEQQGYMIVEQVEEVWEDGCDRYDDGKFVSRNMIHAVKPEEPLSETTYIANVARRIYEINYHKHRLSLLVL